MTVEKGLSGRKVFYERGFKMERQEFTPSGIFNGLRMKQCE